MYKSKLLRLFKSLSADEVVRLSKFVNSPFYNTNPTQVKFYNLLKTAYPQYDQPRLKKERVFQRLFPGKEFNYAVLGNLISGMVYIVEKYLVVLQLEKNETTQKKLSMEAYSERQNCYGIFLKKATEMERYLDEKPFRDAAWYRDKFELKQHYFNHAETNKFKLKKEEYDSAMNFVDQAYILDKLSLSIEMRAREKPLSEKYEIWYLEELKSNINIFAKNNPTIGIYANVLSITENPDSAKYFDLKNDFLKNINEFSFLQQKNILQVLINYSIQEGNKGIDEFVNENFELYKIGLVNDLFLEQGILAEEVYTNIILTSLKVVQFDWCKKFIHEYENYLNKDIRADARYLGIAFWFYYQEKIDETVEYINKVRFVNDNYQVRARVLLLRSYFEMLEEDASFFDVFELQANSFEKFLRRNQALSKNRVKAHINFSILIRKIAQHRFGIVSDEKKKEKLLASVLSAQIVTGKGWLLQQLK